MKRRMAVTAMGTLVFLAAVPVLAADLPKVAMVTDRSAEVPAGQQIEAPTPQIAPGTYHPMQSFAPLVEAVEPAVAAIKVEGETRVHAQVPPMFRQFFGEGFDTPRVRRGEGSGFVISEDGLMLTNAHVIANATRITAVFSDGTEAKATVLGQDRMMDVAVLRLEGDQTWPHVELGSSEGLKVGDWVVAMGNPLGLGHTVTAGIVSGKGRVLGHDIYGNEAFIQTDAAINQGNSGGPLFDLQGRVVGINTAIIANANTVGFAIPISLVHGVLDDLTHKGRVARGYLGVRPQPITPALASALSLKDPKGALVSQIFEGTPAAQSGLQNGDVIVGVDEVTVDDPQDLIAAIGNRRPGETIKLDVLRNGREKVIRLNLSERPGEDESPGEPVSDQSGALGALGLGLKTLPSPLGAQIGLSQGVLVDSVAQGSAADGHVRPGDVILEVNRRAVRTPDEVSRILARSQGPVTLLVVRDRVQMFVPLPRR